MNLEMVIDYEREFEVHNIYQCGKQMIDLYRS